MAKRRRLQDEYRFAGTRPRATARGMFGDRIARVVTLVRRRKKRCVVCVGGCSAALTIGRRRLVRDLPSGGARIYFDVEVRRVACRSCGAVKRERLEWLADNPSYTKRFAFFVGRRCRVSTIKDVAKEQRLDCDSVKTLEMQYMREQLRRVGTPAPRVIGIDEISIRKGHTYRIVVSDLDRMRPIWFGGSDRSEASMDEFFAWLGPKKCKRVQLDKQHSEVEELDEGGLTRQLRPNVASLRRFSPSLGSGVRLRRITQPPAGTRYQHIQLNFHGLGWG